MSIKGKGLHGRAGYQISRKHELSLFDVLAPGERPIPAELLPQICVLLKNFEPLDILELQAGRVAFKIPDPQQPSEKEFLVISNLMKDVGFSAGGIANNSSGRGCGRK